MSKIILLRHGLSQWNLENRFTGWTDVDLTEKGCAEARQALLETVAKLGGHLGSSLGAADLTVALALNSAMET